MLLFTALWSGELNWYFDIINVLIIASLSAAYGLIYCGLKPSVRMFFGGMKSGAMYAGGIVSAMLLNTLLKASIDDIQAVGQYVVTIGNSLLYGLLLSAGARVIENHLTKL